MKDKLRALTLGASKKFHREKVTIEGETFEVRQPSLKERGDFRKKAMKISSSDDGQGQADFDIFEFQIAAVIALTVVPDSDEKVFEESDREAFEQSPAGGWFDSLATVAMELCNIKDSTIKNDSEATK